MNRIKEVQWDKNSCHLDPLPDTLPLVSKPLASDTIFLSEVRKALAAKKKFARRLDGRRQRRQRRVDVDANETFFDRPFRHFRNDEKTGENCDAEISSYWPAAVVTEHWW